MFSRSVRSRVTIVLPVAAVLVSAVLLLAMQLVYSFHLKRTIASQQYLAVAVMAEEVDRKLETSHQLLMAMAKSFPVELLGNRAAAQQFLSKRDDLRQIFTNGLFILDAEGRVFAEQTGKNPRYGFDLSFREYFRDTRKSGKPLISEPFVSTQLEHNPAVMFTVPLFDAYGNFAGMVGGSVNLLQPSFLKAITTTRIGKTGYMFLFGEDRTMILHPDSKRIMQHDIPRGANRLLDRAIDGFDGTDETVNSRGLHSLTSFKHLKTKKWIIGANYPIDEAYAPIVNSRMLFAIVFLPVLALLFFVLRWYLQPFVKPMIDFASHVESLPEKLGEARFFPAVDVREVDTIGKAFNTLISELDKKQQRVTHQAEKFRLFFNEASDPVFITDLDGSIIEVNVEAQRRLGYSHAELLDMKIEELDTAEFAPMVPERIAQLQKTGHATFESAHRCKDGSVIPVEVNAKIINYNGKPANLAVVRDIRDRKQVSQLLQCRNEYLLALHETTLGLVGRLELSSLLSAIVTRAAKLVGSQHGYLYLTSEDGREMRMVVRSGIFETFRDVTIRPGEGLAGKVWQRGEPIKVDDYSRWSERIGDSQREAVRALIGVPLKSGRSVVGVIGLALLDPAKTFSDDQMEMLNRFAALASLAFENARLYEGAQRELSERRKAEESLRIFSYAVEQSPVSIIITSTAGRIEYANPQFTAMTGHRFEDVAGELPAILTRGVLGEEEYRQLWEVISSGYEWRGEFQNRKVNGDRYWEQVLMAPIRDNDGRITNYIIITEDIDDRKRLEGQLLQSQKMEAIGQLAAGIAHDFNNILTAIIGYASMAQMKLPEANPALNSIEQIVFSAERAASLTQGLLAFSRKQVALPQRADLNEIVLRVNKLLVRLIGEQITFFCELGSQPILIMADTGQIEQVLMNLVTNARDALPQGGVITVRTCTVQLAPEGVMAREFGLIGSYALLEVQDNGTGMDQETVKHIFEPFFTTKETGRGTGLGLAIASGIVQQHAGKIICHSRAGEGTTFQVFIPLSEGTLAVSEQQPELAGVERGSEVVLLAEDDDPARTLSKKMLEEFGYAVIEATDGEETLNKYRQYRDQVSLVMMDLMMPKIHGRELVSRLKAINPGAKILLCSGHSEEVISREGLDANDFDLLPKPYKPGQLLRKVREVLDR